MFRKWSVAGVLVLWFAVASFAANLSLTEPGNNAVVSQLWENQKDFLQKSDPERKALTADPAYRDKIRHEPGKGTRPKPVDFKWTWDGGKPVTFTVKISESDTFANATTIPASQDAASATNFKINQKYYWQVTAATPDGKQVSSAVHAFVTENQAPRLLDVPNVTNFRDLGGRVGLNGKRVRQNLIFRSTAFNSNSRDGIVQGPPRFTEAGKDITLNALKIKTELDLRSPKEVADMKGSPLGDIVHWVNISAPAYGAVHNEGGKATLIKEFRLFCNPGNYPINFHCIAGADRTGSLAFVLNAALGVSDAELIRDWEITIFDNADIHFDHKDRFDHLTAGFDKLGSADEPYAVKVQHYLLSGGITRQELNTFRSIMLEK
jgi:protein-tyrosine phosphatase